MLVEVAFYGIMLVASFVDVASVEVEIARARTPHTLSLSYLGLTAHH
jgi:hypothetical protein